MSMPVQHWNPICPWCQLPAIPIMYGYPNEKGAAKANAGHLILGGCVVQRGADNFGCARHHRWRLDSPVSWGRPPTDVVTDDVTINDSDAIDQETLASRLYAQGDFDGAEQAYRSALARHQQRHGEGHPEAGVLVRTIAVVRHRAGRADDSDPPVFSPPSLEEVRAKIERRYREAGLG